MRDERQLLRVDWIACKAYGACALAAPDLVQLDPWGYPIVAGEHPVTDDLLHQARRAVGDCPVLAMSLEPMSGHVRPEPTPIRPDSRLRAIWPVDG